MVRKIGRGGEGRIGCVIWLAIMAVLAYVGWQAIPVKIATAELQDYMEEQAKFASSATESILKKRILRRARSLDLPVTEKNLKVEKISGRIQMEASFTVPLKFPGYTYDWDFKLVVDRPFFIV